MSKAVTQRRLTQDAAVRIQLTPREFKDVQGAFAVATMAIQAIRQQAAQQIAAAQLPARQELEALAKKYRGLSIDKNYLLDPATHSLVEQHAAEGK